MGSFSAAFILIYLFLFMAIEVQVRKGEPAERALRRLKKRLDREGVIRDVRAKPISRNLLRQNAARPRNLISITCFVFVIRRSLYNFLRPLRLLQFIFYCNASLFGAFLLHD